MSETASGRLSVEEALEAFESGCAAVIDQRDVIVVDGAEAVSYLQGQLSQNIEALAVGDSAWSLLLQPQGKVDAWLRATRTGPTTVVLDLDVGFGGAALARLERFKLRTKASFEFSTMQRVAVRGPEAPPAVAGDAVVADVCWPAVAGYDLLGPDASVPEGIAEAPSEALEAHRIMHAIPAMGAELSEATIPAEAGIVDLSVDFTKGCYVGQELVARVDSRGNNTPRRIHRLRAASSVPVGTVVQLDGADVGVITSAAVVDGQLQALASIKRGTDIAQPMTLVGPDGSVSGEVVGSVEGGAS